MARPSCFPRRLLALLVLALLAVACSDSGSTTTSDDETSSVSPPRDASSDPEPSSSDDPTEEMTDGGSDPMDGGATDQTLAPYCGLAAQAYALVNAFDPGSATPEDAERFFRGVLSLLEQGEEVAPVEVASSLAQQRASYVEVIGVLEAAGWDMVASQAQWAPIIGSAELQAADGVTSEHDRRVCGIDTDGPEPVEPPPVDPADIPAEALAYCEVAFEVASRAGLVGTEGPAEVETYYAGLQADTARLVATAPPALADDVGFVAGVFDQIVAIVEAAAWDLDIAGPQLQAYVADPAVDDPMNAAIGRIEQYEQDVCGIVY